jgi:hypothetical protein
VRHNASSVVAGWLELGWMLNDSVHDEMPCQHEHHSSSDCKQCNSAYRMHLLPAAAVVAVWQLAVRVSLL